VFSVARVAAVATRRRGKHASTSIEELCFLCSPCRDVITETIGATKLVLQGSLKKSEVTFAGVLS
jgi:hypothetical protein